MTFETFLLPSNSLLILDIRAGIIRGREKLKYLQGYINTECKD